MDELLAVVVAISYRDLPVLNARELVDGRAQGQDLVERGDPVDSWRFGRMAVERREIAAEIWTDRIVDGVL